MNAAQALDALGRADLSPRGGGREVTFFCPTCQGAGSSRRRRKASINAETGAWTCFACSAKGSARGLLRLLGETRTTETQTTERTTYTSKPAPDPEAVARWLRDLADLPERAAGLRAWARDVRGWPDEVAARVHDVHGLSWSPTYQARPAWAGSVKSRPAILALSDETGTTWTAEARAAGTAADPKAMRLRTRDSDRGRRAFFGSVPEAVARIAAGEGPLLIVEGGPDYVAAAALGFVVVGAHGWRGMPALARAVAERASAQGVRPSLLRVVVVPHIGDHNGVGETGAAQAVAELDGKANVYVARVAETKGDLADLLRDHGADAVRQAIEGAAQVTSAPVHVADAEASTMLAEALRVALTQGDSALPVLQVAAGAGKTTVALRELARRAAAGSSSVALAVSTLALADEKATELRALIAAGDALDVPVRVQRGQIAECELVRDASDDDRRVGIVRGLGIIGRRACLGCPRSSQTDGTCTGWTPPSIPAGVVTVTTHATVAALAELPDLLVVDELPATVRQTTTTRAHVSSLSRGALAARRWRDAHSAHGYLADALVNALDDAADGRIDVVRLDLDAVADLIRAHAPDAEAAARDVLAEGDDPPWPSPSAVRVGAARHWPDVGAWTLVRAVAAAVVRADEGGKPCESKVSASRDQVHAALGEGVWTVETRTPWALPEAGKGRGSVVALDATATESGAEWQAVAEAQGRELRLLPVELIGERALGVHYQTTRLSTRRLFTRSGASVAFFGDAVGALTNALMRACGETPCEVGVLTHKPVADVFRWGVRLAVNPDARAPTCLLPDDHHARAVADVVVRLCGLGWRFVVGHYGADERASNAFTGCDVVALIGSPRPDLGATGADAGVLGLTPEALWRGRVRSAAAQGLSRGRHLRRAGVRLLYAADDDPPTLPSVTWTTEKATTAHALAGPAATGAARIVAELADRWGALDVDAVAELLKRVGVGVKATDARVKVVAAALGWQRWPVKSRGAVGGRPRMVWAADAVAAAWGLDAVRVDLADLPALAAAVGVGLAVVADEVAVARAVVRADEGGKPCESKASASRESPATSATVARASGARVLGRSASDRGVDAVAARAGPRRAAGS